MNSEKSLADLPVRNLRGDEINLEEYRGQVLLIVNVASKCGFTPQYEGLQVLHQRYHDKGLRILAFPCNDFMNQEPGAVDEIRDFCHNKYAVAFDIFEKVMLNSTGRSPKNNIEVLSSIITKMDHNKDTQHIIQSYLRRNKKLKVLSLDS